MKLFTFSGISSTLININYGGELKQFASDVIENWNANIPPPDYLGQDGVDHFRSDINLMSLLSHLESAVRFDGSPTLNAEAESLALDIAESIVTRTGPDPTEDVVILAHSQGTNNLTFALRYLLDRNPSFFEKRSVRCALFDPKVGANRVQEIVVLDPDEKIQFVFFQSQNDLLGDQALFVSKFIDQFPHGNHIWVRGTDHSSIRDWKTFSTRQSWLALDGYAEFLRDCRKKFISLQHEFGKPGLNTVYLGKYDTYKNQYPMKQAVLSTALLPFLQKGLPKVFQS